MTPGRFAVKLYLDDVGDIAPADAIPVFHDWIRRAAVPGMLVDVADYSHVKDGPGVILIGHDLDYALDLGEGRPGVLCRWKRGAEETAADRLAAALDGALKAATELEAAGEFATAPHVDRGHALVSVEDRMAAPNTPESLDALRPAVDEAVARITGAPPLSVSQAGEPGGPLAARVVLA